MGILQLGKGFDSEYCLSNVVLVGWEKRRRLDYLGTTSFD